MKFLFIILLLFCTKLHAQIDSAQMSDTSYVLRIKYFSISNDSMRLNVANAKQVTIKQYKDHNTIIVYPLAVLPKTKLDTTIKKRK